MSDEDVTLAPASLAPDVRRPDAPALPLGGDGRLDAYVRDDDARARHRELLLAERAIAGKYMALGQRQAWPYAVGGLVSFAGWVALWPLCIYGLLPLWLGCALSTVVTITGWLYAHEAMHETIARKGTRGHFWNELTGQLSLIPLLFPLAVARQTHLAHHRHTNDPRKDPDFPDIAPSFLGAIVKVWLNRQPNPSGQIHHYRRVLFEEIGTPEAKASFRQLAMVQLAAMAFWFGMCWAGHAVEVALLWWVPRWLALWQIHISFGWEPHHPHDKTGRYTSTRVFRSRFGHWASLGIEGHLAHHLYPRVPMHLTPPLLRELAPLLAERGVDIGRLRPGWTAKG